MGKMSLEKVSGATDIADTLTRRDALCRLLGIVCR